MKSWLGLSRQQSIFVFVVVIVVFALFATIRTSWSVQSSDGDIETIAVLHPAVGTALFSDGFEEGPNSGFYALAGEVR